LEDSAVLISEYRIYEHSRQGVKAVKQGWSWPAFLFGFVWAIFKNMYVLGLGVFFLLLALAQVGRALGGGMESALDQTATVLGALIAVGFGLYGNALFERHLRNRGFAPRGTVSARGAQSARKQFLEGRAAG
jgi:hypothetical protein